MRVRLVLALLAAALAAGLSLPARVGPAHVAGGGPPAAQAAPGVTETLLPASELRSGERGRFRVLQVTPAAVAADVVFLHGHADRADNHRALFDIWSRSGVHVIAVDLPSHGATSVRGIDAWSMDDLAALVGSLDRRFGVAGRPLILAGWSFGGLVVTRILQERRHLAALARRPAAAVLLVPAVNPLPFTGGDGIARRRTLVHDPDPAAPEPRPVSPLLNPVFAARLLATAWAARATALPADLPVLVAASDPTEDVYVDAEGLMRWARHQRVTLLACSNARHAVHLEPWPTGPEVRDMTVRFLASAVAGVDTGAAAIEPPVSERERTCHAK